MGITGKVVGEMVTTVGIDGVVMMELEGEEMQGFFDIGVEKM